MTANALAAIFQSIAQKMKTDFDSMGDSVYHRGLRGHARETLLVQEYLEKYLPRSVIIRRNVEIVASDGQRSGEVDIAICDSATPPLWTAADVEVIPIECVFAVIEVKSRLDSPALRDSWKAIATIKQMPKVAYMPSNSIIQRVVEMYGRPWDYFPTVGFVFGYTGTDFKTLVTEVVWRAAHEEEDDRPGIAEAVSPEHRVDGVWVLDKGSIIWGVEGGYWLTATPGPVRLTVLESTAASASPLPLMTMQLQGLLQSAFSRPFRIGDYLGETSFGKATYFAAGGNTALTTGVDPD